MRNNKIMLSALVATPFMLTQILNSSAVALTPTTASIEIDETELSTRRGVEKTYKRIAKAAEKACTHPGRKSLHEKTQAKKCTADLVEQMIAQANSPQLSAYSENQNAYELASK